ncbi:MDR family MFS transporter [Brevibacillus sp. H7]|uniref:MDR family MFS transporter n=1 Tax=Brevibacillus sp. H7 TaxID=3349138 RepID=UPI00382B6439
MKEWRGYLQAYHPIVQLLMAGTVFVTLTSSMSMPFLAIYLSETTRLGIPAIGLIIGAGPLAATIGGFVGGVLSDLLGRQKLMILSLLGLAIACIGFVSTANPAALLIISVLRGLAGSFFGTISKALMGDLTPEEKRFRVFSNRYMAINLGFSIGPMVGAFLGIGGSSFAFALAAAVYVVYAIALILCFRAFRVKEAMSGDREEAVTVSRIWQVLRRDTVLFLFTIGGVLLMTVHGQMSVTLSQYLTDNLSDGVKLFGLLMSLNGITVFLVQVPLTRWSERLSLFKRIVLGSMLLALGEIGFATSAGWSGFIVAMVIFTLGEILIVPAEYAQVDQITPQGMRGTYYGAQSFGEFGSFLGPWAGGMILSVYGGPAMFTTMAVIAVASLYFFWKGRKLHRLRAGQAGQTVSV